MNALYKVSVAEGLCYEIFGDFGTLKKGDKIIIQCERFQELATVSRQISHEPIADIEEFENDRAKSNKGRHIEGQKIPVFQRMATEEDFQRASENREKAESVFQTAIERIHFHNLEMKLIQTHYSLDRKLLVFQFSAEGRIDFRELLRDLSASFHVRVELRQIGVRDEAAILGGLGTCGKPFCCATFLPSFNSINVKMAKLQGLSLNPQNISGCCGRLRCCLQYESEHYSMLQDEMKQAAEAEAREHAVQNQDSIDCVPHPEHENQKGGRSSQANNQPNANRKKNHQEQPANNHQRPAAAQANQAGISGNDNADTANSQENRENLRNHGRHHKSRNNSNAGEETGAKLVSLTDGKEIAKSKTANSPQLVPLRDKETSSSETTGQQPN